MPTASVKSPSISTDHVRFPVSFWPEVAGGAGGGEEKGGARDLPVTLSSPSIILGGKGEGGGEGTEGGGGEGEAHGRFLIFSAFTQDTLLLRHHLDDEQRSSPFWSVMVTLRSMAGSQHSRAEYP